MRALVIEDNQVVTDSIRTILRPEDYDVDTVAFGEDGVVTARRDGYDVIILDLMLPDIDGHDVLCRMRKAGVRTPVLILSGLEEALNKDKCLDNGADDYLTKPLDRKDFLTSLSALTQEGKNGARTPSEARYVKVNLDTNTFLMMHR
jgi:two-component system cell cycle response regulator CtrA